MCDSGGCTAHLAAPACARLRDERCCRLPAARTRRTTAAPPAHATPRRSCARSTGRTFCQHTISYREDPVCHRRQGVRCVDMQVKTTGSCRSRAHRPSSPSRRGLGDGHVGLVGRRKDLIASRSDCAKPLQRLAVHAARVHGPAQVAVRARQVPYICAARPTSSRSFTSGGSDCWFGGSRWPA